MTFLADDNRGLIVFEADSEEDAKLICGVEGWRFIGACEE